MRENIILEGRGAPPKSPVEWVKHKLAVRYTETGRIGEEIRKIEKVMGTLSPEQRSEAEERLHLEGKVKNKVVRTVIRDAVVATIVVTTGTYLAVNPDVRANLAASANAGIKLTGEGVSVRLDNTLKKLKPDADKRAGFFAAILIPIVSAAKTITDKGTKGTVSLLENVRKSSLAGMEQKVIRSRRHLDYLTSMGGRNPGQESQDSIQRATNRVEEMERRHARSQLISENVSENAADAIRSTIEYGKMGIDAATPEKIATNRIQYPITEAMPAARRLKDEAAAVSQLFAAEAALHKAKAGTDEAAKITTQRAFDKAIATRQAFAQLEAARQAKKLAKSIKVQPNKS